MKPERGREEVLKERTFEAEEVDSAVALAYWRKKRALSQRELASLSGVGMATIARVEMGLHQPRPSTVRKLAAALDIDPSRLV